MELVFTCPQTQQVFRTDDYRIVEDRGFTVDGAGRRRLLMKVAAGPPCPFCGGRHVYDAEELACPFGGDPA